MIVHFFSLPSIFITIGSSKTILIFNIFLILPTSIVNGGSVEFFVILPTSIFSVCGSVEFFIILPASIFSVCSSVEFFIVLPASIFSVCSSVEFFIVLPALFVMDLFVLSPTIFMFFKIFIGFLPLLVIVLSPNIAIFLSLENKLDFFFTYCTYNSHYSK